MTAAQHMTPAPDQAPEPAPARARALASRIPRPLFERSMRHTVLGVVRTWAGVLLAWWACGATRSPWMLVPAIVLIGTLQYHLNVLGHDGIHFLLSNSRKANDFVCRWFLHGPHGAPLGAMRANHLNHHTNFGDDSDVDRQYYDVRRFADGKQMWRWLLGSLFGGMLMPIVRKLLKVQQGSAAPAAQAMPARTAAAANARLLDIASVLVSQAWIAGLAWALTGWWFAYGVLWLLPLFTVMMGLNSIRSMLEHASTEHVAPELSSFVSSPLERFFLSPFNMNVHAEHHMVPAVPWHQLPALRHFLQHNDLYGDVRLCPSYRARAGEVAAGLPVDLPAGSAAA